MLTYPSVPIRIDSFYYIRLLLVIFISATCSTLILVLAICLFKSDEMSKQVTCDSSVK